ncbi:hypothetical protein [Marmoricola endophyticus]|nr:hypothetical protein [Marmoricola endophyticus]
MTDTGRRDDIRPGTLDPDHREVLSLIGFAWLLGSVAVLAALWGLLVDGTASSPVLELTIAGFALVGSATFAVCACVKSTGLRIREQIR